MRPYVSVLLVAWLFACLLITGCGDSKVPLSEPSKASPDRRLIGVWKGKHPHILKESGVTYYHIGRLGGTAPEGVMRVVAVSQSDSGEVLEPFHVLAFPSDVGGHSYLNIARVTPEQLRSLKEEWSADLLDSYILAGATQEQRRYGSRERWTPILPCY